MSSNLNKSKPTDKKTVKTRNSKSGIYSMEYNRNKGILKLNDLPPNPARNRAKAGSNH